MEITRPTISDAEALVDYWVELAADQRQHGSRLLSDDNREAVADAIARHIVTDGLLIARKQEGKKERKKGVKKGGKKENKNENVEKGESEEILGFVMYHVEEGRYLQDRLTGIILNLYVRPAARGNGIGSELLGAAESELAAEGVDTVTLEVLAANEAARRFYARHGYESHRLELAKRIENDTHSKGDP